MRKVKWLLRRNQAQRTQRSQIRKAKRLLRRNQAQRTQRSQIRKAKRSEHNAAKCAKQSGFIGATGHQCCQGTDHNLYTGWESGYASPGCRLGRAPGNGLAANPDRKAFCRSGRHH